MNSDNSQQSELQLFSIFEEGHGPEGQIWGARGIHMCVQSIATNLGRVSK